MLMGPYKNLDVWNMGMKLVKEVYSATSSFPKSELFGIVNQMRRCAVSIPSNIAEGYGRGSNTELTRFLYISLGSSNELDTQLIISKELGFLSEEVFDKVILINDNLNKMLRSLIYTRQNYTIGSDVFKGLDNSTIKP